ncbi:MAG: ATP-dependent RecD-like DNA helicase [Ruminococcus sp.]|nr:ATP-dependent RecD-like DNA helicase [Ruminococcus sp.]
MNQNLISIKGTVENIIFRNEYNGYTVINFNVNGRLITVVGEFVAIKEGESLKITGSLFTHSKFGEQFKAESYEQDFPDTAKNIEKYLASGIIKSISKKMAHNIVSTFGDKSLEIIEKEPHRLVEVLGTSKKKCREIAEESKRIFSLKTIKAFCDQYNIKYTFAIKIHLTLGINAVEKIQRNPYILCKDNIEIDFRKADEIAFSLGIEENSPQRIIAGICSILKEDSLNGHSCLPISILYYKSIALMEVSKKDFIKSCIKAFENKDLYKYILGDIIYIYLPEFYRAEKYIADWINSIQPAEKKVDCEKLINDEEMKNQIKYHDLQRKAISEAVSEKAIILTGGPGTGKTTTLNTIISIFEKKGLNVVLTAPTGRASKRMTELTGHEAKTIHRLLGVSFSDSTEKKSYKYNEDNPIDCDVVIIDETSMVDVLLFETLLRALPSQCKLIITGDSDQLPSVGAGNLLRDLVDRNALPVIRLTEIFRQAQQSLITTNAHRIVAGEYPDLSQKNNDFFFFRRSNYELALQLLVSLIKKRLPDTYGYSPVDDIQVIAPSRKGFLGTNEINRVLQEELNPHRDIYDFTTEISIMNTVWRYGDKVMQNVNNYDIKWKKRNGEEGTGIFNGDIGKIVYIRKNRIYISFDGKIAVYTPEQLITQIELAYAITVHKSQGCEFEVVIMPVQDGFDMLNNRNLLYTAVTRAKKLMILIGNENVICNMVDNSHGIERYTCLKNMLAEKERN